MDRTRVKTVSYSISCSISTGETALKKKEFGLLEGDKNSVKLQEGGTRDANFSPTEEK